MTAGWAATGAEVDRGVVPVTKFQALPARLNRAEYVSIEPQLVVATATAARLQRPGPQSSLQAST